MADINHKLEILEREQIRLKCMYQRLARQSESCRKDEMVTVKMEEWKIEAIRQKVRIEEETGTMQYGQSPLCLLPRPFTLKGLGTRLHSSAWGKYSMNTL